MVIQSAKYSKWTDGQQKQQAAAAHANADKKKTDSQDEISLADFGRKQPPKTRRMKIPMKYSPLVDRYLFTHKYETKNNVRSWKMLITQRTEAANLADRKLKAYNQILEQVEERRQKSKEEYDAQLHQMDEEMKVVIKKAKDHIKTMTQKYQDLKKNADSAE
jgi:hypothetical protein